MSADTNTINIEARIGEGIYLVKDVSKILGLDYEKVYRWIIGYWTGNLQAHYNYTFGEQHNRAINFYSLIEFYTFFKLREKGLNAGFKARITSMLIYAFFVFPIIFALVPGTINIWLAVLVIGIAAAAHQAWSANIFITVSDMFPKDFTATVTGIGGIFGGIAYRCLCKSKCLFTIEVLITLRLPITSCLQSALQLICWPGLSCRFSFPG